MITIRRGNAGDAVTALQHRLNILGFYADGIDGEFGPKTEAALLLFQGSRGLTPDGICGPLTWDAVLAGDQIQLPRLLSGARQELLTLVPVNTPTRARRLLEVAIDKLGVTESPQGSNGGPGVDEIVDGWYDAATIRRIGKPPWCALFCSWAMREAAGGSTWGAFPKRLGSAEQIEEWAVKAGVLHPNRGWGDMRAPEVTSLEISSPEHPKLAGALFTIGKPWAGVASSASNSATHVGIVVARLADGTLRTIEGNVQNGVRSLIRKPAGLRTLILPFAK